MNPICVDVATEAHIMLGRLDQGQHQLAEYAVALNKGSQPAKSRSHSSSHLRAVAATNVTSDGVMTTNSAISVFSMKEATMVASASARDEASGYHSGHAEMQNAGRAAMGATAMALVRDEAPRCFVKGVWMGQAKEEKRISRLGSNQTTSNRQTISQ